MDRTFILFKNTFPDSKAAEQFSSAGTKTEAMVKYVLELILLRVYYSHLKKTMDVGYSESKYRLRILETVTLRMCSDFLYQLRSHKRHFVKFVLCLCLFLRVKPV